ncbi:hypothetical protein NMY22_g5834 [Coprinellus aureogranulatus]|nr:hypothetical protein NMY22_g5834 [Coprinellus aureogranulatus]
MATENSRCTVNDLPREILLEIFAQYTSVRCLPKKFDDDTEWRRVGIRRSSPFVLCKVCRQWKELAASMPALWSSVYVRAAFSEFKLQYQIGANNVRKFRIQAARAGRSPRALHLDLGPKSRPPDTHTPLPAFLEKYTEPFSHLQQLCLLGDATKCAGLERLNLPKLEFLFVDHSQFGRSTRGSTFTTGLPILPSLKRFACIDICWDIIPASFPWYQLTHLHLKFPLTPDEILVVLCNTPNIQDLGLRRNSKQDVLQGRLPSVLKKPRRGDRVILIVGGELGGTL